MDSKEPEKVEVVPVPQAQAEAAQLIWPLEEGHPTCPLQLVRFGRHIERGVPFTVHVSHVDAFLKEYPKLRPYVPEPEPPEEAAPDTEAAVVEDRASDTLTIARGGPPESETETHEEDREIGPSSVSDEPQFHESDTEVE